MMGQVHWVSQPRHSGGPNWVGRSTQLCGKSGERGGVAAQTRAHVSNVIGQSIRDELLRLFNVVNCINYD